MSATTATDASTDITDVVLKQHKEATRQLAAVLDASNDDRAQAFASLEALLSGHEEAEEAVIYPALRKLGDEGTKVADARTHEEEATKKTLAKLHAMEATSAEFTTSLRESSAAVHNHAASEESEVLPLLKRSMSDTERQSMGDAFLAAQKH